VPQKRSTDHFELKPAQQRVLGVLKSEGTSRLTRARYEELSGVSRSQAAYDLAELVEHGMLERLGSGRATRYRIVHSTTPGNGGRRRWTEERIRAALQEFCAGRDEWPSATEFKQAGRFDLYVAASRYGGIGFWTSELGLTRDPQAAAAPPAPKRRQWTFRPRLQWVPAAAVAALALALAGGGHVRLSPGGAVLEAAPPQLLDGPSLKPPTAAQRAKQVQPARHTVRHHSEPAAHHAKRTASAQQASTTTGSTELASVQSSTSGSSSSSTPPAQTTTPARTTSSTPTPTSSSNPAPLPAPSGGNAARPLPPPRR
jgi:hypothetical protein